MTSIPTSPGAGFIPNSNETIFVSKGGDDSNDGTSQERPVLTISEGITKASSSGATNISVGDGDYDEQLIIPDNTDLRGSGVGVQSTTASTTTITAANASTVDVGFVGAQASNSTAYLIEDKVRSQFIVRTLVVGPFFGPVPTNITGIDIRGTNDDIPINITNGECRADDSTLISFTGESATAVSVDLGTFTNFGNDFIGINMNSSDADQILNISFINVTNDASAAPTGTIFCRGTSGIVNLMGINAVFTGETFLLVEDGLRAGIGIEQVGGDIKVESGGLLSVSTLGILGGDLILETGGSTLGEIHQIIGNLTIEAGATFRGTIGPVLGVKSIDPAAIIDGVIDGIHYGTYKNPQYVDSVALYDEVSEGSTTFLEVLQHDFVIPYDGLYRVDLFATWRQSSAAGRLGIRFRVDDVELGAIDLQGSSGTPSADDRIALAMTELIDFTAGTKDIDLAINSPTGAGTAFMFYRRIILTLLETDKPEQGI